MDIDDLHSEVLRAFNDICVPHGRNRVSRAGFSPLADAFVEEGGDEIVVRFELPGMSRETRRIGSEFSPIPPVSTMASSGGRTA